MEGVIVNFRGGRHTQKNNHIIIKVEAGNREDAAKMVGKKVVWKSPAGKELVGEIRGAHGNSGAVRAIFETGMPGQSVGTKVSIN